MQAEDINTEIYVPPAPARPTPNVRIATGGSRNANLNLPTITLLVPDHVAFTSRSQPVVYWHISGHTRQPTVLTLSINDEVNPLLELELNPPIERGIHVLKFSDHNISLAKNKIYEWSVSINEIPGRPSSGDLIARAFIQRVDVNEKINAVKNSDDIVEIIRTFAQESLWYDALAAASTATADPNKQSEVGNLKASMLRQVGIKLELN